MAGGSGFSSVVHETSDGRVHRRAVLPEAREALQRQFRFLPWLAARVSVPIPVPEALDGQTLVYRKIPGEVLTPSLLRTLDAKALAGEIARFITALHSLPVAECVAAGVSELNRTEELLGAFERTLPFLSAEDRRAAENWRKTFAAEEGGSVFIHGDLWYENILVDARTGRLCGVLDFDAASIGDPAWDLATQIHLGVEFARMVFEAYPKNNAEMLRRARQLFQLRAFEGLDWAARNRDQVEFEESLRKLRDAGVLPYG